MDSAEDKLIICADCKKEFTHTVEDQKRYAERGFSQDPKRCRECRQARKDKAAAQKANPRPSQDVGASGDFGSSFRGSREGRGGGFGGPRRESRGGFGGGGSRGPGRPQDRGDRPSGAGGGFRGGFSSGPRQSFEAVCAACGITPTVPLEPTQGP